jgi:hypothetical protein
MRKVSVAERVLLVGKRAAVLTRLQAALLEIGIEADLTQDLADADDDHLRAYAAVAFGRAVRENDRARMREAFRTVNPEVTFVDGLAPITPLLVAQFEQALDRRPEQDRRLRRVTASDGRIELELRAAADVRVLLCRLTRLYRTRTDNLLHERLQPGTHTIELRRRRGEHSPSFGPKTKCRSFQSDRDCYSAIRLSLSCRAGKTLRRRDLQLGVARPWVRSPRRSSLAQRSPLVRR